MKDAWTEETKQAFIASERLIENRNAKLTANVTALLMLAGSILDFFVYPGQLFTFFILRLLSAVSLIGIAFGIKYYGDSNTSSFLSKIIPLPPITAMALMILVTDGGQSTYYAGLNLVLVGLAIVLRWTMLRAGAMSLFILFIYSLVVFISDENIIIKTAANNFYFLFITGILVTCGSYFYEVLRQQEFLLKRKIEIQNQNLEENQQRLQELDEAKTNFFSNISHELRTPLTIILGAIESLKESTTQSTQTNQKALLDNLHSNALRLLKLINELLDLVRFDQKKLNLHLEPVNTEIYLKGLVTNMQHIAHRKEIAIQFKSENALPTTLLDPDKLEKVILNLLINAVKFTPNQGTIRLETSWQSNELTLRISDTGVGMDKEKLKNVFERFWQADSSSNRKFGGVGIGLSLVNSFIELMQGTITVDSELNQGTTFTIKIPAEKTTQLPGASEIDTNYDEIEKHHREALVYSSVSSAHTNNSIAPDHFKNKDTNQFTILIAEDEKDLREFLTNELNKDYNIIEAQDGIEGLELAKQLEPDLILLDYMLPEMNGLHVCKNIRDNFSTQNTPVIMLTARADDHIKLECLKHGANDFLAKPFALAELKLRVGIQKEMLEYRNTLYIKNQELEVAIEQIKENEAALLRHEKLSSLGTMSAGIIHEINNPLNYVKTALHMLEIHGRELPKEEQEDFEDTMNDAKEGLERVVTIVSDLRSFAVQDSSTFLQISLSEVIHSAEKFVADQLEGLSKLDIEIDDNIKLYGNSNQLVQVFINFFQNSLDAIDERQKQDPNYLGEITISAKLQPNGDNVALYFRDNGCGISEENLSKIFDPFFTQKDIGAGMGLGLSIVHQILERHNAKVTIDSIVNQYTEFALLFPSERSSLETPHYTETT